MRKHGDNKTIHMAGSGGNAGVLTHGNRVYILQLGSGGHLYKSKKI